MTYVTRFAPSPTGPLHLGHAYSAILAHDMAAAHGGRFLLRIEDIDTERSKPHWETQIYDDLAWLGLSWERPTLRQSDRLPAYRAALDDLWARGLLYPCFCTRRDILASASAPQEGAAIFGPDGLVYPGTCRTNYNRRSPLPEQVTLRLDMEAALKTLQSPLSFTEYGLDPLPKTITLSPETLLTEVGDIVLSRKTFLGSYHLCVVLDDAVQGITHVTRGNDLFEATQIHVLLQKLLDLPTPLYHHHRLIRDQDGKRLAKRDDAKSIAKFRAEGVSPSDIGRMVGLL